MKTILTLAGKRKLVSFLKKYRETKERAHRFMKEGDINSYLKELIEIEKNKNNALSLFTKEC